jgi:hypothetical protein
VASEASPNNLTSGFSSASAAAKAADKATSDANSSASGLSFSAIIDVKVLHPGKPFAPVTGLLSLAVTGRRSRLCVTGLLRETAFFAGDCQLLRRGGFFAGRGFFLLTTFFAQAAFFTAGGGSSSWIKGPAPQRRSLLGLLYSPTAFAATFLASSSAAFTRLLPPYSSLGRPSPAFSAALTFSAAFSTASGLLDGSGLLHGNGDYSAAAAFSAAAASRRQQPSQRQQPSPATFLAFSATFFAFSAAATFFSAAAFSATRRHHRLFARRLIEEIYYRYVNGYIQQVRQQIPQQIRQQIRNQVREPHRPIYKINPPPLGRDLSFFCRGIHREPMARAAAVSAAATLSSRLSCRNRHSRTVASTEVAFLAGRGTVIDSTESSSESNW